MLSPIREEKDCTQKELQELANTYWHEPGEYTGDWVLRVFDQVNQNIIQEKQEFTDLGLLSQDKRNNTWARTPRDEAKLVLVWLFGAQVIVLSDSETKWKCLSGHGQEWRKE